jgi:hypothetical protein
MANASERRKQTRIDVTWPIQIFTSQGTIEAETQNVSSEGVYVCCNEPLHLNEIVNLSISPPDREPIRVTGKVVWSDFYGMDDKESPVCIGICLVEIGQKESLSLDDAISSCLE